VRNIAHPALRGRQQAQVSYVPALHPARTAWRLPKHHDVLGHRPGNPQQQPNAVLPIADDQLGGWTLAKYDLHRRKQQDSAATNAPHCAIQALEKLLASK
jgi:hypothetical protein